METPDCAMIKSGDTEVINVIVAEDGFEIEGYYFIKIEARVFVTIGMNYDKNTGGFN
ncbi:MAG: hypothetical protein PW844_11455 [Pantoea sp.]|uniref:hypothetical protein n=1 Tax=Pantoea sp. TaxID=69393 RepID=UPI0023A18B0E|nr:hypothetical protein [Pantoea sp.]MDE1187078.1 hypothetical protein [Pantoea sp.]